MTKGVFLLCVWGLCFFFSNQSSILLVKNPNMWEKCVLRVLSDLHP